MLRTALALSRARYREYVPPLSDADLRLLAGLPTHWADPIPETGVALVEKRARATAVAWQRRGHRREAEALLRRAALLERTDELHRHASNLETLAGLVGALAALAHEETRSAETTSLTWRQTGAMSDLPPGVHGPAFRATAALRNRAFRWILAALGQPAASALRRV